MSESVPSLLLERFGQGLVEIADGLHLFPAFLGKGYAEPVLDGHDDLHDGKRIGAEVIHDPGVVSQLVGLGIEFVRENVFKDAGVFFGKNFVHDGKGNASLKS